MCKKHGKPIINCILRYNQKRGCKSNTGCPDCIKERNSKILTTEMKNKRAKEHDSTFIGCKNHPKVKCSRAYYKFNGTRMCNWCTKHHLDGSLRPAEFRRKFKEARIRATSRGKEQVNHNTIPSNWSVEYHG